LKHNFFFFDHRLKEKEMQFIQSKYNPIEAKIMLSLAKYLVNNSHHPEKITILTLYGAQLIKIRDLMQKKEFKSLSRQVKTSTVDRYQGEENDIILLSLVRSNKNNSIGFLKISNRVCVALSRARKGKQFL
jgi:superfamily I DNA and/or RNA helicase